MKKYRIRRDNKIEAVGVAEGTEYYYPTWTEARDYLVDREKAD